MRRAIGIVEKAFAAHGNGGVRMPPKIYLHLGEFGGDFRAMPACVMGTAACGVKWVNVHPLNRRLGLPAVMAMIILSDPRTGYPLAVMDGTQITNLRTGAAGAVAAKYLANKFSSRVGFVGCGIQARFQLSGIASLFRIGSVRAFDTDRVSAERFARFARTLGYDAKRCDTVEECVSGKDIVVTTTPSRKPLVRRAWIGAGTHINAIGADARGKEELEPSILNASRVVVDDATQAMHSGEINVPVSRGEFRESGIYSTLGLIISGRKRFTRRDSDITVFDSTGLAIQDIAVASYIYERRARDRNVRRIPFI
jgi:alanine dehydrogenase